MFLCFPTKQRYFRIWSLEYANTLEIRNFYINWTYLRN